MGIIRIIDTVFEVYSILILARIILFWIRHNPYQPLIRFVYEVTDPYLKVFKRLVPPFGQVDFSPVIALFALELIRRVILFVLIRIF